MPLTSLRGVAHGWRAGSQSAVSRSSRVWQGHGAGHQPSWRQDLPAQDSSPPPLAHSTYCTPEGPGALGEGKSALENNNLHKQNTLICVIHYLSKDNLKEKFS